MESDRASCMICMESEGALYRSPCRCRGVLVHAECFAKMIQRPNYRSTCAVCKASYGTAVVVEVEQEIRCIPLAHVRDVVGLWLLLTADVYLAVFVTYVTVHMPEYDIDSELSTLMIVMCACLWSPAFVALVMTMANSRICCCECVSERTYAVNVSHMIMV